MNEWLISRIISPRTSPTGPQSHRHRRSLHNAVAALDDEDDNRTTRLVVALVAAAVLRPASMPLPGCQDVFVAVAAAARPCAVPKRFDGAAMAAI
jgi:hypothetical protein